jgi:hypothetical protein
VVLRGREEETELGAPVAAAPAAMGSIDVDTRSA